MPKQSTVLFSPCLPRFPGYRGGDLCSNLLGGPVLGWERILSTDYFSGGWTEIANMDTGINAMLCTVLDLFTSAGLPRFPFGRVSPAQAVTKTVIEDVGSFPTGESR